jgi:hypothetical protein
MSRTPALSKGGARPAPSVTTIPATGTLVSDDSGKASCQSLHSLLRRPSGVARPYD